MKTKDYHKEIDEAGRKKVRTTILVDKINLEALKKYAESKEVSLSKLFDILMKVHLDFIINGGEAKED